MIPSADGPHEVESTRDLVGRARRAPAVFRDLYERIAPSLVAWTRLRTGPGNTGSVEAEDLLQEVWLRALAEFSRYDPARSTFRAWIFGIAKNVSYEAWREGERFRPLPRSPEGTAGLEEWPDVATTIRTRLGRDEAIANLFRRVEDLDPCDRQLLLHCGFEDMSCAQAARQLGLGAEAASKRWQRLRSRLAERPFRELLELEA